VAPTGAQGGGGRGPSADESARSVYPGEDFSVRVHTFAATSSATLSKTWFETGTGESWGKAESSNSQPNALVHLHVPTDAEPTAPYFTRPTTEQPYYDIANENWRERSFAPYPLSAWAEFTFDSVPIRLGMVVQTLARITGVGGVYQPLVVTPAIGVRVEPEARLLPVGSGGSPLPVSVTVHAEHAADGTINLKLPEGWHSEPAQQSFHLKTAGDTEPLVFPSLQPAT